jgi:hypothetical protein
VRSRLSAQNDDDGEVAAQDVRLFLTQRCIQSFMFLLAATRDLHTVWWLDNFVQPITINNYWDDDVDLKPGAADTFRENDKRCVIIVGKVQISSMQFPTSILTYSFNSQNLSLTLQDR